MMLVFFLKYFTRCTIINAEVSTELCINRLSKTHVQVCALRPVPITFQTEELFIWKQNFLLHCNMGPFDLL